MEICYQPQVSLLVLRVFNSSDRDERDEIPRVRFITARRQKHLGNYLNNQLLSRRQSYL